MMQPLAKPAEQHAGEEQQGSEQPQQLEVGAEAEPAEQKREAGAELLEAAVPGSPAAEAAAALPSERELLVQSEQGQEPGQPQQIPQQTAQLRVAGEPGADGGPPGATQQAEEEASPEAPLAAAVDPGDVFAAELSRIMTHYQEAQEAVAADGGGEDASAGSSAADSGPASAGSAPADAAGGAAPQAAAGPKLYSWRQRKLDEGGFMFVMRALSLMVGAGRGCAPVWVRQRTCLLLVPARPLLVPESRVDQLSGSLLVLPHSPLMRQLLA